MKRIGVVGTFVWDTIQHPDRPDVPPLEQWGGLSYSLSAFAAACPPGWCIVPIARIGMDLAAEATSFLAELPHLCGTDPLHVVREPNNRVELRYYDRTERTERLSGGVAPWSFADLGPHLFGIDALFINHISGFELDLATAEAIRQSFPGPIYTDLHSLCLGPPTDGPRRPRPLANGDRWVGTADYVQMNGSELELVGGLGVVLDAMRLTGGTLLVTRGGAGASYWTGMNTPGGPITGQLAPPGGAGSGDPTGCGDVWGAVAYCGLLVGLPIESAVARANCAAAAKLNHPRMAGLVEVLEQSLS